ncbi:hypothetical protein HMPREF0545_0913 [Ligilactobacillus salivarius DSM 20555 = ATCC 11741]|uniref:Uncharacterized protein n=1 Tax=Ligilactobacillus salivarius DSM 20555 = ATCC 11741 TaxID=1423799 RepID=C2EGZ1_9LACO|nr:hypothetical protein HMPREF0545_0913 [Ligilactobacillus salivarius DSM 20555 = ATCC 11741]
MDSLSKRTDAKILIIIFKRMEKTNDFQLLKNNSTHILVV